MVIRIINRLQKYLKYQLVLILIVGKLFPQDFEVSARVDSNNYLIGDWIKLYINLKYNEGTQIEYPSILDSIPKLELIERTKPSIIKKDGKVSENLIFIFTAFDSGTYIIPELIFKYQKKNDNIKYYKSTNPIPIFIHKIDVDPSQDIKDIKPPLSVPIFLKEILTYIGGFLLIILVSFIVYYLFKKKKKKEIWEVLKTPKRPAHEIALEALQSLESEKLWQRGEVKQYHSKLTEIIRTYIEDRFNTKALESTTEEIISDLRQIVKLDGELITMLQEMLTLADLVKFAKALPLPDENHKSLQYAYQFIRNTIPEQQKEKEK